MMFDYLHYLKFTVTNPRSTEMCYIFSISLNFSKSYCSVLNHFSFLLQVRGSLAKRGLEEMEGKGLIKKVSAHRSQLIYTRITKDSDDVEPVVVVEAKGKQKGKKGKKDKAEEADPE